MRRRDQPGPAWGHRHHHPPRHRLRDRLVTDETGGARAVALQPGTYNVQVELSGLPDRGAGGRWRSASARRSRSRATLKVGGGRGDGERHRRGADRGRLQDRLLHQHRPRADPGTAGRQPRLPEPGVSRPWRAARAGHVPVHRELPGHRRPAATPASPRSWWTAWTSPTRCWASRARSSRRTPSASSASSPTASTARSAARRAARSRSSPRRAPTTCAVGLRLLPRRFAAREGRVRPAEERLLAPAVRLHRSAAPSPRTRRTSSPASSRSTRTRSPCSGRAAPTPASPRTSRSR